MMDKEYIKSIIDKIVSGKKEKNIVPSNACLNEVLEAVRDDALECLRDMWGSSEVVTRKTLNSVSFKTK